jgi:hypothetical protein
VQLLSEGRGVNILVVMQSSCAAFCSGFVLQLGAVPILAGRLFDMAVLMSSSHRLLILGSPQSGLEGKPEKRKKMTSKYVKDENKLSLASY